MNMEYKLKEQSYYDCPRTEMLPFIPSDAKTVLDVGCGRGAFARSVKDERGAEVWGIELSVEAKKAAETRLDKVIGGDCLIKLDEMPAHYFDCIIFNDIIEHVADPDLLLKKAKNLLKEKGTVVCSIPNVRYWNNLLEFVIGRDWRYRESGVLDSTHLRFFTKKSIIMLFELNGYAIDLIQGINPVKSRKYALINALLLGFISDSRFLQYAVKARVNEK